MLLAIVAFTLLVVMGSTSSIASIMRSYAHYMDSLHWLVQIAFMFVLALCSVGLLSKLGVVHPTRSLVNYWRYPSVLWSICIAVLLPFLLAFSSGQWVFDIPAASLLDALQNLHTVFFIGFLGAVFLVQKCAVHLQAYWHKVEKNSNKNQAIQQPQTHHNSNNKEHSEDAIALTARERDLLDWIEKEIPLEDERNLLFNREIYVERITKRFQQADTSQHLALCGEYGMGKSTVLKLVCRKLEQDPEQNWLTVNISTWGRHCDSLGSYILEHMLNGASEYVDISALKPLPEKYRLALNAKGGWFSVFNQLLGNANQQVVQQFNQLQQVLTTINLKILVVLEDLDRNSNTQDMITATATLIEQLRSFYNIHFVVAVGYTEDSAQVISRVCDYREDLANDEFSEVFDDFLALWVKRAQQCGLALPQKRHENMDVRQVHRTFFDKENSLQNALSTLVNTPRKAKAICRRVNNIAVATKLLGEVDLQDMLLLQVIRECSPALYQFICRWELDFVYGAREKDKIRETRSADLQALLTKEPQGNQLKLVLQELFPVAKYLLGEGQHYNLYEVHRVQMRLSVKTNLQRFNREALASDELSDQTFIREFRQYQGQYQGQENTDKQPFVPDRTFVENILTDPSYYEKVEVFFAKYGASESRQHHAKGRWFRALIHDTLFVLRSNPKKYLHNNSTLNERQESNYSGLFIEYLFEHAPSYGIKAKTIDCLFLASLHWLMCHRFSVLHQWLEVDFNHLQKLKSLMTLVDRLINYLKVGIQRESLDIEMLTKHHHLLAYNAKQHLSWERSKTSSDLKRLLFSPVWCTESATDAQDSLFHILLDKAQFPEQRPHSERVHFMVLLMFFFFNVPIESNLPRSKPLGWAFSDGVTKCLVPTYMPQSLLEQITSVGLSFSAAQYQTAAGGHYAREIEMWLQALREGLGQRSKAIT